MLLNKANKVLGIYEVSIGGMTVNIADAKLIFSAALKACACGIILAHNHPFCNLKSSTQDEQLRNKIKEGGQLFRYRFNGSPDHLCRRISFNAG